MCVMSDSFDTRGGAADLQASGDLPDVEVVKVRGYSPACTHSKEMPPHVLVCLRCYLLILLGSNCKSKGSKTCSPRFAPQPTTGMI